MKKLFVIIIVALVAVFIISSASVYAQEVSAGMKAGVNIATLYGDDVDFFLGTFDKKVKTGVSFGAFITYDINDIFAIQPEFLVTKKGMKVEGNYIEDDFYYDEYYYYKVKGTISFNYLEFPVLAKISIPNEGSVQPNIFFGPALALMTSAKMTSNLEMGSFDISDEIKSFDFGLVFGAGMDVDLGIAKLTFDGRYTLGLISVDDSLADLFLLNDDSSGNLDIKNSVISIMVGYGFLL
ncbi:MAG: PorT family protein [Deltaproteobacteria bacterium]|nr:MAG: PorT family protein [Deltaproteobacteria bacterium]